MSSLTMQNGIGEGVATVPDAGDRAGSKEPANSRDVDFLRKCAWDIGERKPAEAFTPGVNHVGLAMVTPCRGFAHWRILHDWIEQAAGRQGDAWHDCRMILRLYDVSYVEFDGLNAQSIQDHALASICGQMYLELPHSGTWQLAEVGFLLRAGEFLPAARSNVVAFAPGDVSSRGDQAALLVHPDLRQEEIGNLWDQERILEERRTPKLRKPLRIGAFAFPAPETDPEAFPTKFISELARGLCEQGHEVHVFAPASDEFPTYREVRGVHYQPLQVRCEGTPLELAHDFARAARERLEGSPPFDLIHLHEWMTGLAPGKAACPTVLSLSSIEATRCDAAPAGALSQDIRKAEREVARSADCILTPDWLREKAVREFRIDAAHVHAFSMEGRLPDEWDCPLDYGQVKGGIGVGPLDRMLLFIGPLEHAAGVDLILEALPILLQRWGNLRVAFAGTGELHDHLAHRADQLGVGYAVRLLGHVESPLVTRLLRAAEALVLPSRYRVPFDDAVVDLARHAGRPVVTTQGGPAHLVRHEETGIVTYDNPGSMVWALDRILGDPAHARQMGDNGRRCDGFIHNWSEVSRRYLELCAACFPQLTETHG